MNSNFSQEGIESNYKGVNMALNDISSFSEKSSVVHGQTEE